MPVAYSHGSARDHPAPAVLGRGIVQIPVVFWEEVWVPQTPCAQCPPCMTSQPGYTAGPCYTTGLVQLLLSFLFVTGNIVFDGDGQY